MSETNRASSAAAFPRIDADRTTPAIRSVAETLANIEFEHASELRKLVANRTDQEAKLRIAEALKRHRERREPYLTTLAELESQLLTFARS
jgi:hypothetical protein